MPIKITPIVFNETSVFSEVSTHISDSDFPGIVTPGEIIFSSGADLITGHGTYRVEASVESAETIKVNAEDDQQTTATASSSLPMRASLAGRRKAVNKLVYVEPPTARYSGNVGDTVVGRIVEVSECFYSYTFYLLVLNFMIFIGGTTTLESRRKLLPPCDPLVGQREATHGRAAQKVRRR